MKTNTKTFKIMLLPTKKASIIIYSAVTKGLTKFNYPDEGSSITQPQHLYIISDDEIKEGDWIYIEAGGVIRKVTKATCDIDKNCLEVSGFNAILKSACKKIVATTDESFEITVYSKYISTIEGKNTRYKQLPEIPESFIEAYIKAYNEGKPITEVDLEMVATIPNNLPKDTDGKTISFEAIYIPKTRPDNTVIIYQSKMYSRDEVIKLISFKVDEYGGTAEGDIEYNALFNFKEWIQDNL